MKKILLIALAVGGLAFVSGQRADAQVTVGLPGVGGISVGFPGGYYGYPTVLQLLSLRVLTGGRTTIIPSHIRTITVARDIVGTTGIELITANNAIIITTDIELISLSQLWK